MRTARSLGDFGCECCERLGRPWDRGGVLNDLGRETGRGTGVRLLGLRVQVCDAVVPPAPLLVIGPGQISCGQARGQCPGLGPWVAAQPRAFVVRRLSDSLLKRAHCGRKPSSTLADIDPLPQIRAGDVASCGPKHPLGPGRVLVPQTLPRPLAIGPGERWSGTQDWRGGSLLEPP